MTPAIKVGSPRNFGKTCRRSSSLSDMGEVGRWSIKGKNIDNVCTGGGYPKSRQKERRLCDSDGDRGVVGS